MVGKLASITILNSLSHKNISPIHSSHVFGTLTATTSLLVCPPGAESNQTYHPITSKSNSSDDNKNN